MKLVVYGSAWRIEIEKCSVSCQPFFLHAYWEWVAFSTFRIRISVVGLFTPLHVECRRLRQLFIVLHDSHFLILMQILAMVGYVLSNQTIKMEHSVDAFVEIDSWKWLSGTDFEVFEFCEMCDQYVAADDHNLWSYLLLFTSFHFLCSIASTAFLNYKCRLRIFPALYYKN